MKNQYHPENDAVNGMTDEDTIYKLAMLLAGSIPALDEAANVEANSQRNKLVRQVTARNRAAAARDLVAEVSEEYGWSL